MVDDMKKENKRGQEEIVGFVVIVVIVSVILLFFLVFSLTSNDEGIESYRANSFLQAALAYTSNCEDNRGFLSVDDLIAACYNEERCGGEEREYACDVLNETLINLLDESWPVGEDRPYKGYRIEAISGKETVFSILKGNITSSYELGNQIIPLSRAQIRVAFIAYK